MAIVLTAIVDQSQLLMSMFMVMGMMVLISISMRMHDQLLADPTDITQS